MAEQTKNGSRETRATHITEHAHPHKRTNEDKTHSALPPASSSTGALAAAAAFFFFGVFLMPDASETSVRPLLLLLLADRSREGIALASATKRDVCASRDCSKHTRAFGE